MYRRYAVKGIKKVIPGLLVGAALLAWTLADTPVVAQPSNDNSGELETTTLEEVSAYPDNDIDPNNAQAHFNQGLAYYDKGMLDEAITEFKKSIEIDLEDALAHSGLVLLRELSRSGVAAS